MPVDPRREALVLDPEPISAEERAITSDPKPDRIELILCTHCPKEDREVGTTVEALQHPRSTMR
jgi:hypothetical protein